MLLDLVVAELLARLEPDQHRARLVAPSGGRPASGFRPASRSPSDPSSARREPTVPDAPIRLNSPMALAVDRYELGPIGTNCYVVRAERGASEAVVVDPGGDAAAAAARARADGRDASPAILVTHTHYDHIGGVADLAEATGAPVYVSEVEAPVLAEPGRRTTPGIHDPPVDEADVLLAGGETIELAGIYFEIVHVPGHSPGHLAFYADGALFSGDVLFAGLGRPHRPADGRLGDARRVDPRARRPLPARDRRLLRPRARRRRSAPSSPAIRSSPSCAPSEVRGPARHPRHPPVRAAPLAAGDGGVRAPLRALRLPADRHARLRGHRALRAHVRRGLGRRHEGDVHVHRPRRPLADAARGGDGADRPRVPRARPAPRAAAAEALHDRDELPLRPAAEGPLPRVLAARSRGDRLGRPGLRRGGDPALRRAPRPARRDRVPARAELDRRPELPARVPRPARPWLDEHAAELDEATREQAARNPLRALDNIAAKPPAVQEVLRQAPDDRRLALRRLPRALRRGAPLPRRVRRRATSSSRRSSAGSTTTRARPGSSSAPRAARSRRSPAAAATTGSPRSSAARTRPGSASARGSSGCCSRSKERRSPRTKGSTCSTSAQRAPTAPPCSRRWPSCARRA